MQLDPGHKVLGQCELDIGELPSCSHKRGTGLPVLHVAAEEGAAIVAHSSKGPGAG